MIKIEKFVLSLNESESLLPIKAAKYLRIAPEQITSWQIHKKSIDARDGISFVYSLILSLKDEKKLKKLPSHASYVEMTPYLPPKSKRILSHPPVVVGAGPAGLFCTYLLALAGQKPILLERGKKVEEREKDVQDFWKTGVLNPHSNVQFGEGGAGAFSDGKLNTGTKDIRHAFILQTLVDCGAPESILYDSKPHVGTDKLHIALKNIRNRLIDLGADLRFEHQLKDVSIQNKCLTAITVDSPEGEYTLPCDNLVLALGHSARDTVQMLYERGIPMEAKPFAVGVRIEHKQSEMDAVQYKEMAGHPSLPASTYKLSYHVPEGRGVFSFCVCPGGQVVAAASEENRVVTNGMSEYARDKENINGGLLVSVTPEDFGGDSPLAGIAFQRKLEEDAYQLGGGNYHAPAQLVGDFLKGIPSTKPGHVLPSYLPQVTFTDLSLCLPPFIVENLRKALPELDKKIHGFANPDAILTAVESRSSSPVRIMREKGGQCSIKGIYPCGEGAGYAGGILSAAADGMHIAESILEENK